MTDQKSKQTRLIGIERPEPRYQEIIKKDGDIIPEVLLLDENHIPPIRPIPLSRYTSQDFFDLELAKMWPKVWQFACREEQLTAKGDYYVYEIGKYSIIIIRTDKGDLRAYHNSCLHRGTKLKPSDSIGTSSVLQCPYHGWTWSLMGELEDIPCEWDFPHLNKEALPLPQVRVDVWNSLVFINLAEQGASLEDYLEVLPAHFKNWDFSDWYTSVHVRKELPCNWKAAQDAFIEAYHTALIHPQAVGTSGDINQQHDIFGDNVSRDIVALGVSSPTLETPLPDEEILAQMLMGDAAVLEKRPKLSPGETARTKMAKTLKSTFQDMGIDVENSSIAETIDSIKYSVFPNLFIFAGLSLRVLYLYRPLGTTPDKCTFDILFMRPVKKGESRPPPAPMVTVSENESYADVPGMDPGFGELFDQDTEILKTQHAGMQASKEGTALFSAYLESRLRHTHDTLEKYIYS